jgi:alanyl-tRNA synthetase
VLQGVTNNFHTDGFAPLIATVEQVVGAPYRGRESDAIVGGQDPASYRVLADHARAVAFLLADGVFPSNEGRGYVLRRILRRAVRHAYLLGRTEAPTLYRVVEVVIETMGEVYPELRQRAQHLVATTRAEEERFLATIEGGLARFDQLAPLHSTQGSTELRGTVGGEDAFRLYDTFGFPIDLTELMARERGYAVDITGFERALERQRTQSQDERRSRNLGVTADALTDLAGWTILPFADETITTSGTATLLRLEPAPDVSADQARAASLPSTSFVGYDTVAIESQVAAIRRLENGRVAVLLRETPFYAESGGQVSDRGEIVGDGWRVSVDEVRKIDGRTAAVGVLEGEIRYGPVVARVPSDRRRDTERNHTATHLLHAALRTALGEHVHQAGSVVEPDRLRFDFTHHGPVGAAQLEAVEAEVNRGIWAAVPLRVEQKPYREAVAGGAMALFGEKYGDVVRVVDIPGISTELCGGTHVRNTAEIGLFRIVQETGVAAGVRRITALTGPRAFEHLRERERTLEQLAELLKAPADQVPRRVQAILDERRQLERRIEEARRGGGADQVQTLAASAEPLGTARLIAREVQVDDVRALQALGDALREQLPNTIAVLGARLGGRQGDDARGGQRRPARAGRARRRGGAPRRRSGGWTWGRQAAHGAGRDSRRIAARRGDRAGVRAGVAARGEVVSTAGETRAAPAGAAASEAFPTLGVATDMAVPPTLAVRIREHGGGPASTDDAPSDAAQALGSAERCVHAAARVVGALIASGATSRASALDLLAADALATLAFERASVAPQALPRAGGGRDAALRGARDGPGHALLIARPRQVHASSDAASFGRRARRRARR